MRDRRRLFSDATAAAARMRDAGKAEATLVETLVHAVRIEKGQARRRRFWAARLLAGFTKDYAEVRDAVRTLATATEWHVRYRAMRCLDSDSPRPFAVEILRQGLLDDHPAVRYLAACAAGSLLLTELVDDLAHYVRAFPAESTWVGRFWLPLLRDGYVLDDRCTAPHLLCVARGRQMTSRHVDGAELAKRGVAALVAEMQGGD